MELLNAKQDRFAQCIARGDKPEAAYRYAFALPVTTSADNCRGRASKLLAKESVRTRVQEYRESIVAEAIRDPECPISDAIPLIRFCSNVVMGDYSKASELRIGCCVYCYGDGHQRQWIESDYMEALAKVEAANRKGASLDLPDIAGGFGYDLTLPPVHGCPKCGGEGIARPYFHATADMPQALRDNFQGVKQTRNGIELQFGMTKKEAVEILGKLFGAFTENSNLNVSGGAALLAAVAMVPGGASSQDVARAYMDLMREGE